jgi:hypothetical protein
MTAQGGYFSTWVSNLSNLLSFIRKLILPEITIIIARILKNGNELE